MHRTFSKEVVIGALPRKLSPFDEKRTVTRVARGNSWLFTGLWYCRHVDSGSTIGALSAPLQFCSLTSAVLFVTGKVVLQTPDEVLGLSPRLFTFHFIFASGTISRTNKFGSS